MKKMCNLCEFRLKIQPYFYEKLVSQLFVTWFFKNFTKFIEITTLCFSEISLLHNLVLLY